MSATPGVAVSTPSSEGGGRIARKGKTRPAERIRERIRGEPAGIKGEISGLGVAHHSRQQAGEGPAGGRGR